MSSSKKTAAVVWMHGLGDTSAGWSQLRRAFARQCGHVEWVFPNAPRQPVSCNGGFEMTSWFDIWDIPVSKSARDDAKGFAASAATIHKIVDELVAQGIPSNRIVIGGFSQGGAMSLYAGLSYAGSLAGIVCFSGWAALRDKYPSLIHKTNAATPVLMCHGTEDPTVLFSLAKVTNQHLTKAGVNVDFHPIDGMGHSSSPKEVAILGEFLQRVLPFKSKTTAAAPAAVAAAAPSTAAAPSAVAAPSATAAPSPAPASG